MHEFFFQKTLLDWFHENKRIFSWRSEKDPFKILIAEVMLQRTKAEQVESVYSKFIHEFPEPSSIGSKDKDRIMKYFKKLGLFWRSGSVIHMTEYILKEYDGIIPASRAELLKIPGVGEYIADAILVFAFNKRITVIDSNVVRLISRFFGFKSMKGEIRRNKTFRDLCQKMVRDVHINEIKNFNWALIDFSHFTCKSIPNCDICPFSKECIYFKSMFNNTKIKI